MAWFDRHDEHYYLDQDEKHFDHDESYQRDLALLNLWYPIVEDGKFKTRVHITGKDIERVKRIRSFLEKCEDPEFRKSIGINGMPSPNMSFDWELKDITNKIEPNA